MKRINIGIPDDLYDMLHRTNLKISSICRKALHEALLKEWAEKEERKRLAMLE